MNARDMVLILPPLDGDAMRVICEITPRSIRYVTVIRALAHGAGMWRVLSVHRTREAAERRAARCGDTVMLAPFTVRVGDVA